MSNVMRATRVLQKVTQQQPTAMAGRLAMRPSSMLAMRSTNMLAMRRSPSLLLQSTRRAMMPVPKEEHSAHTISQRIRTLKKIPVELLPLAFVLAFSPWNTNLTTPADTSFSVAIVFGVYSLGKKLYVDRSLRLARKAGH